MTTNPLNSILYQAPAPTVKPARLSLLGIIFFIMGAPNLYAFVQRRADNATFSSPGTPRYALVVLLAMAIAGIVELSVF